MQNTTLTQIQKQLDQWNELDLPQLVGKANPDTSLKELSFADLDGRYFVNLSSRVLKQFQEEFNQPLALCYPNTFNAPNTGNLDQTASYQLHSVIQNFVQYLAASNFQTAAHYLKVLVSYQMQNGFWDRSKRKVHHPGSIGVNNMLEELQVAKVQLEETVDTFRDKLNELQENYESVSDNVSEISSLYNSASNMESSITTLQSEVDGLLADIKSSVSEAEKEETSISTSRELIDQFTQKISDRETQLEKQHAKTEAYEKQLEKFKESQLDAENLAIEYSTNEKDRIASLIKEATLALELNTARGMSKEFQSKANSLKPDLGIKWQPNDDATWKSKVFLFFTKFRKTENSSLWWLIGSGAFIMLSVFLALALIAGSVDLWGLKYTFQNGAWYNLIGRISVVGLLVTAAIYCAKQYNHARMLYEDYAYRKIIVSSLPAFLKQLEEFKDSESLGAQYLQKVLEEVKAHPTRETKKSNEGVTPESFTISKDQVDLLKTLTSTFKS